jgi:hypothetical protein
MNEKRQARAPQGGGGGFATVPAATSTETSVFVPIRFHRRSGRTLVVTQAPHEKPNMKTMNPILLALARGFRWRARMDAGEFATHRDLARSLGLERSYVSRLMRLALLAPDIIEAIVEGHEPDGLSLDTLLHGDIPDDWPGQRRALGFPEAG